MSRLHILEGVSGTGKTSLPIAIAKVLGGTSAKIEVQAGWRDKNDLLGYYNEFEKHYREHEFTRSLYEALTPHNSSGLFFVVLDEMNLSKPEHYFADFLSLLEDQEGEGGDTSGVGSAVLLNDQSIDPLPRHMRGGDRGGVEMPLGENVWFIGTANHDETTSSFAPKTLSRAHSMELPRSLPDPSEIGGSVEVRKPWDGEVLGYRDLVKQFDKAKRSHQSEAKLARDFFESALVVLEDFDEELSWGPRILRQIDRFIPVIIESGGSLGLGVDHLLYTKLTRRLRDSFSPDMRAARQTLSEHIQSEWPCKTIDPSRTKSVQDLERQIRKG